MCLSSIFPCEENWSEEITGPTSQLLSLNPTHIQFMHTVYTPIFVLLYKSAISCKTGNWDSSRKLFGFGQNSDSLFLSSLCRKN